MLPTIFQKAVNFFLQYTDVTLAVVIIFAIAYIGYNYGTRHQSKTTQSFRQPPRLKSLPVIGSIPFLPGLQQLHIFFLDKLRTMGPVIGFNIMSRNVVVLQTREAITEAFTKTEFSDRPFRWFEKRFALASVGFMSNYTDEFRKYRQSTLTILKEFGFGKLGGIMESRIHDEVSHLITELKASNSRPTDPANVVNTSVMNVIASILFGKRFSGRDGQADEFIRYNEEYVHLSMKSYPLMSIPALRYIPYFGRALSEWERILLWFCNALQQKVFECENDEMETPSFIRSYIEAEGKQNYDKTRLTQILRDLIIAGSETSATTVMCSIVLLANHQDIQARLQTEIDNAIPRERLPSLNDQSHLTFVEAFILELMRFKTIVPLAAVHEVSKDAVVQGFSVPARTIVLPNLYAAHMDPNVWGDPASFRPERFIDQDGEIVNREKVLTFSVGKRSCLGEKLARQEIFLFVTGLLQNFTILPKAGCPQVECRDIAGGTLALSPFSVRFVTRQLISETV